MENEINDNAKQLVVKYLSGEASSADEQKLFEWIRENQQNEQFYLEAKKIFDTAGNYFNGVQSPDIDLDHEWNQFKSNVGQAKVRSFNPTWWLRIAASLVFLVVAGGLIYLFQNRTQDIVYHSGNSKLEIRLADATVVMLNRHSELRVDKDFGHEKRAVMLKGEAFFEVNRDPQKPFIIRAKDAEVEVLGTSFNVQAYDSLQAVEVVVETGVVKLSHAEQNDGIRLVAGARGLLGKSIPTQEQNRDINYQAWNTQLLIFREASLDQVVQSLRKAYNVDIQLTGTPSDSCLVTVSFDHQTLDAVLNVLVSTLNIQVKRSGNSIEIIAEGC